MKKGVYRLLNGKLSNGKKDIVFRCQECGGTDVWLHFRQNPNTGEMKNYTSYGDWEYCEECGDTDLGVRAQDERTAA